MNPIVQLHAASVDRGDTRVVHDVDLAIAPGSWFGMIGANGSGKTSLLRALGGRLPFAAGSCRIAGEELVLDRAGRATRFGFAPPADTLPNALRVGEAFELIGGANNELLAHLGPLRTIFALNSLLDRWIGDCSAGMRQRIAISLAFIGAPECVILDEPFNWLDPVVSFDLRRALRAMAEGGLTLITALHDLGTLAAACDSGLVLADGRVAMALDEVTLRTAAKNPFEFEHRMIDLLRSNARL
ncbi:ATP-binding cassette domain-containing protein [Sphingomonas sp. MMS24-J45]|uniref:ATP-binding cassette domain-containing protein n=1 Tax=Sphingomonas sp. MMS24-J45 TaxID=3238806 RepID=UPI003850A790